MREPPLDPDKLETRRTGPNLRKLLKDVLRKSDISQEDMREAFELLDEMQRRPAKYAIARAEDPDPDPQTIIAIREFKRDHPSRNIGHKHMARWFGGTSTRVISYALVGTRDGSQVYDAYGVALSARRRKRGYSTFISKEEAERRAAADGHPDFQKASRYVDDDDLM